MTVFQYLTVAGLVVALLVELIRTHKRHASYGMWLIRSLTWTAAAAAILSPQSVQLVAGWLGIRRGADLVLYVFILLFLATSFYFYSRYWAVQRQVTELIRRYAIERAQRGSQVAGAPPEGP